MPIPVAFCASDLRFALKFNLFAKLLTVDKGLKMRYDLLQAEAAKRNLIEATIDLTGYTIVADLDNALQAMQRTLEVGNRELFRDAVTVPTLSMLLPYDLDIARYLQSQVLDWATKGRDEKYALLQRFALLLEDVEMLFISTGNTHRGMSQLWEDLAGVISIKGGIATLHELPAWELLAHLDRKDETAQLLATKQARINAIHQRQEAARLAAEAE